MAEHNCMPCHVICGKGDRQHVVTLQAKELRASGGKPCVSIWLRSQWKQSERCALMKGFRLKVPPLLAVDIHAFICTTPCLTLPPLIHHTSNMFFCKDRWCTVSHSVCSILTHNIFI